MLRLAHLRSKLSLAHKEAREYKRLCGNMETALFNAEATISAEFGVNSGSSKGLYTKAAGEILASSVQPPDLAPQPCAAVEPCAPQDQESPLQRQE